MASVSPPAFSKFNVAATIDRVVTTWERAPVFGLARMLAR